MTLRKMIKIWDTEKLKNEFSEHRDFLLYLQK